MGPLAEWGPGQIAPVAPPLSVALITALVITSIGGRQTDTYRYTQVSDNIDFYKPGTQFKIMWNALWIVAHYLITHNECPCKIPAITRLLFQSQLPSYYSQPLTIVLHIHSGQ